jgi:hypothetical protein
MEEEDADDVEELAPEVSPAPTGGGAMDEELAPEVPPTPTGGESVGAEGGLLLLAPPPTCFDPDVKAALVDMFGPEANKMEKLCFQNKRLFDFLPKTGLNEYDQDNFRKALLDDGNQSTDRPFHLLVDVALRCRYDEGAGVMKDVLAEMRALTTGDAVRFADIVADLLFRHSENETLNKLSHPSKVMLEVGTFSTDFQLRLLDAENSLLRKAAEKQNLEFENMVNFTKKPLPLADGQPVGMQRISGLKPYEEGKPLDPFHARKLLVTRVRGDGEVELHSRARLICQAKLIAWHLANKHGMAVDAKESENPEIDSVAAKFADKNMTSSSGTLTDYFRKLLKNLKMVGMFTYALNSLLALMGAKSSGKASLNAEGIAKLLAHIYSGDDDEAEELAGHTEARAEGSSGKKKKRKSKSTPSPNKKQRVEVPPQYPSEIKDLKDAQRAVNEAMKKVHKIHLQWNNPWRTNLSSLLPKKIEIMAGLPAEVKNGNGDEHVSTVTEYARQLNAVISQHNAEKTRRLSYAGEAKKWKTDCANALLVLQKSDTTAETAKAKVEALVSRSQSLTAELAPFYECMKMTLIGFGGHTAILIRALRALQPFSVAKVDLEPEASFQPKSKAVHGGAAQVVIDHGGEVMEDKEEDEEEEVEFCMPEGDADGAGPSGESAAERGPVLCVIATQGAAIPPVVTPVVN